MAHVDCKVDLFTLDDFEFALVLLHVDGNEFIADLWRVFCSVHKAELALLKLVELFRLRLLVAFSSLFPAYFVETLSEEDHKCEDSAVECVVDLLADSIEIEGKRLIHKHVQFLSLCEA